MQNLRLKLLLIGILAFLFQACSSGYMLYPENKPKIVRNPDVATLVILRDTSFGRGLGFFNYLDRKFIGETVGWTYFVTEVTPGKHTIGAVSENTVALTKNFEAGKIYAFSQGVNMGVWKARVRDYYPLNENEMAQGIADCYYTKYNTQYPVADLDQAYWQSIIDEQEGWIKDDPEGYKKLLEYKGF